MTAFNKGFYSFILLSIVNAAFAQNRLILPGIGLIELNADSVRLINTSADIAITSGIESYSMAFDSNGDLLFYSNNEQVFDRNGMLMSNGDLMIYAQSTTQGSAIFKSSYQKEIYYIVNLEELGALDTMNTDEQGKYSQGRLFLSTIDMSKNNGLGAITSKNQLLYNNLTEKLSVTRHPCGGYWIVGHERYNDHFISLYINDGIVQDTVISAVGFSHEEKQWTGEIKFSPDGKKLAVMKRTSAEIFSFNPFTGEISDQIVIFHNPYKTCNNCNYYSCEFSKSGDILYMIRDTIYSVFTRVLQKVDLTRSDAIIVNMGLVSEDHNFISKVFRLNDNYLYVTQNNQQPYISMVEQGDSFENSNYKFYGVSLGKIIWSGAGPIFALENDVPIQNILPPDTTLCRGDHITIDLSAYSGHEWSDGSREAIRRIDSAGTYMVRIETDQGCLIQDSITLRYYTEAEVLQDTTLCAVSDAQECRNRIWNFKDRSGIEFLDNGEIVNISNNLPFFMESSSTVSDCSGLLFYANAETIWNKNHEVMDNGDSLGGHWSASQGISIIQHPTEKSKFYVFTLGSNPMSNLNYSIVDLNENNGLGKVIEKKIFLHSDLTEKMVAVKGPCNTAWLITHENNSDRFVVFSFGKEGISSPQYYSVGLPAITFSELDRFGNVPTGKLRISYDGKYLIHASFLFTIELFSFDTETGRLSDPIIIQSNKLDRQYYGSYSAIISPKNKYIYTNERIGRSDNTTIARYQISDQGDIHSTREVVYEGSFNDMHPFPTDLAISPYGTILISGLGDYNYLSAIQNPDAPLEDIQFSLQYHKLNREIDRGISGLHEPPIYFDDTIEENPIFPTDTILCLGDHITIDLSAYSGHDWSDGSREAIRRIDSAGTYLVSIETDQGCLVQDSIKISYTNEGDILRDTSLCPGSGLLLDLRSYEEVLWSDGSEESLRLLTDEGSFRVSLMTAEGCLIQDTISVRYIDTEALDLGADESLCADEAIQLIAPVGSESYIWSTGEQTSSITVTEPGYYYLTVVQDGCMITDSILINRREECHTDCNIYIPNAIKLNSSLGNERLSPVSNCTLSDYQMDIYDRWGGLLYRSLSPDHAWDGTTSGQQVNSGVYLYRLSYRYPDAPQSEYRTGSIMVYR